MFSLPLRGNLLSVVACLLSGGCCRLLTDLEKDVGGWLCTPSLDKGPANTFMSISFRPALDSSPRSFGGWVGGGAGREVVKSSKKTRVLVGLGSLLGDENPFPGSGIFFGDAVFLGD